MTMQQDAAIPRFAHSFSRRVLLLFGVLSLASGLLLAGIVFWVGWNGREDTRREVAAEQARQLAGQAAPAVLARDDAFLADALERLAARAELAGVAVCTPDGELVISRHWRGPGFEGRLDPGRCASTTPSRRGVSQGYVDFEEPVMAWSVDAEHRAMGVRGWALEREGRTVGRLVLRARLRPSAEEATSLLWFSLALGGGVFLAGLLLAVIGMRRVWIPFRRILRGVERFRQGDLSARIQLDSKDELGHIADSFNRLARDLAARMEELQGWKNRLEAEVLEKTEEIQDTSRFLNELIAPFERENEIPWARLLRLLCQGSGARAGALHVRAASGQFRRIASFPESDVSAQLEPASFEGDCQVADAPAGLESAGSVLRRFNLRNPDGLGGQLVLLCPQECRHQHYLQQVIPALTITLSNARAFVSVRELVTMLERNNEQLSAQTRTLEEQKNELERANRLKSQFVANMSHELRIPLNAIIGYSEMLSSGLYGPVNEEQTASLQAVEESGRNLLNLINTILDHSRLEADRMPVYAEKIDDLRKVVRETVSRNGSLTRERDYQIEVSLPPTPILCITDGGKVQQILTNLISNAVKFTEKGHVRVLLEARGDQLELAVEDTGCGIPAEEQEKIFQEFHQVDGSATRAAGGTGLGLSVSRRFARLLGGSLTVRSEAGSGSTFTLRFPRRIEAAPAKPDSII